MLTEADPFRPTTVRLGPEDPARLFYPQSSDFFNFIRSARRPKRSLCQSLSKSFSTEADTTDTTEADATDADIVVSGLSVRSPSADSEVRPKKTL